MKYLVRPMRAEDYVQAVGGSFPWLDTKTAAEAFVRSGPAYTGLVNDAIAVVAGVAIRWPGVGTAWAAFTDVGREYPRFAVTNVMRGFRRIIVEEKLRRVDAEIIDAFDAGWTWVEWMGFALESVMPLYGPNGETFRKYVLFPKVTA